MSCLDLCRRAHGSTRAFPTRFASARTGSCQSSSWAGLLEFEEIGRGARSFVFELGNGLFIGCLDNPASPGTYVLQKIPSIAALSVFNDVLEEFSVEFLDDPVNLVPDFELLQAVVNRESRDPVGFSLIPPVSAGVADVEPLPQPRPGLVDDHQTVEERDCSKRTMGHLSLDRLLLDRRRFHRAGHDRDRV